MFENKNWYVGGAILLALLYAFNSFLEGLSFRSDKNNLVAEKRLNRLLNDRGMRNSQHQQAVAKPRTLIQKATENLNPNGSMDTVIVPAQPAAIAGATKAGAANETKKTDDKKKQAKKKKKPTKPVAATQPRKPMALPQKPKENTFSGSGVVTAFANTPQANTEKTEQPTPEEWERRLLYPPSYEETTKFINEFQAGHLDASTYYSLVDKMLNSRDESAREFGVMALASTPRLESFERLVLLTKTERSQAMLEKIEYGLRIYQNAEHFGVLTSAMKSSDEFVVRFEAAYLVQEAAKHFTSSLGEEGPTRGSRGGPIRQTGLRSLASLGSYTQMERFLEEALRHERNGQVSSQMQSSLDAVKSVLLKSRVAIGTQPE